jgi:hypothetical protein
VRNGGNTRTTSFPTLARCGIGWREGVGRADERMRRRNTKQRKRGCSSKDWRGKHCWSHPGQFSNLSNITNTAVMMKRE